MLAAEKGVEATFLDDLGSLLPLDVEYAAPGAECASQLGAVDREHATDCRRALLQTIVDLKTRRDPRAMCWVEGLPVVPRPTR